MAQYVDLFSTPHRYTTFAMASWIVTNRKDEKRKRKIQLINAVGFYKTMLKKLGEKRNEISDEQIKKITNYYNDFKEGEYTKIFNNDDFGYWQVTVERPSKDNEGIVVLDKNGKPKADPSLRDSEIIPLKENIDEYFEREVLPYVPDAWMDRSKDKKGYEINFTKYFYKFQTLRSLEEIRDDILKLEKESERLLNEIIQK